MVPQVVSITRFGLPAKIVDPGLYLSKIMEYKSQFQISRGSKEYTTREIGTHYFFIGDIIDDFYPFDKRRN